MNKEIEKLENYVIIHKYKLGELLVNMQEECLNNDIYILTHDELEMILNYVCLLQKFSIKYFELKRVNKRSKKWKR